MKWGVLRYDINIRIRKRLLLYRMISIDLYIQKTLFRWTHSHNFKASNIFRLSHLWGNGFILYILITSTTSLEALMKLETNLSAFLTSSSGYPFKCVPISRYPFNLSFLFSLFLLTSSMQLLCLFPRACLPFLTRGILDITWIQHDKIVGYIFMQHNVIYLMHMVSQCS